MTTSGNDKAILNISSHSSLIKEGMVSEYKEMWGDEDYTEEEQRVIQKRKEKYAWLTNRYYDLATSFYGE